MKVDIDIVPMPVAEIVALAKAIGVTIDSQNMTRVRFFLSLDSVPSCEVEYVGRSKDRGQEVSRGSALENIQFTGENRDG